MKETLDSISTGNIQILQPRKGYRYTLESLILPFFLTLKTRSHIAELGAGSGIISMILAKRCMSCRITALEIQERLYHLLTRNLELNRLKERIEAVQGDICKIEKKFEPGNFDLVCVNPPYRKARSGRINPDPEKAIARHEIALSLTDLVRGADYLLKGGGKFALIYLPERLADLIVTLRKRDLEPRRMQTIHSFPGSPPVLLMLEAVKGAKPDMKIEVPFHIYRDQSKAYSEEMDAIYRFQGEG